MDLPEHDCSQCVNSEVSIGEYPCDNCSQVYLSATLDHFEKAINDEPMWGDNLQ